jgi:hypothetical protein
MRTATTSPDAAVIAAIAQTAARSPNRSATTPASVRAAVAEIDSDGNATLVFAPGRYTIGKRGRLTAAIVQGLPVDPIADLGDTLGDEVTAWLAEQDRPSTDDPSTRANRGSVATLDRDADLHESTPDPPDRGARAPLPR